MLLNAIAEIAGSSVTFWVPTYTTEHLGLSAGAASAVYTIVSFSTLFSPFIALFIYEKISRNGPMIAAFFVCRSIGNVFRNAVCDRSYRKHSIAAARKGIGRKCRRSYMERLHTEPWKERQVLQRQRCDRRSSLRCRICGKRSFLGACKLYRLERS